ncbi:urea ABC transporter permease subunit UrtB [Pseudomonas veronii]|jgi:urea transport system permease protein|uniref:urea ABC transporter permease subunit UrtB n=1 Tax=Pseudomonas TaxID=286 RepID=UPI000CF355CE|nr:MULTISPECIES: urea ABC transporter permease subunit UrtB [Pseudomonas]MCT8961872.1 urea ABC transporter permease subunit UrtB [Pseudomonas veronii]MCT9821920.1 urea ABC transporter permease subunit UrtB [Pseudomonas veronii]NMX37717.1 urea ABC transporter permease subunit UrtB [Pseudomonas veronii]NMX51065.1 urea ABC transporter permease subunit UrtB [Pseudomonas veronii]QPO18521.1 urea ABC transporter permease subunit UrtB [Pseudomonas sp. Y39-6]
MPTALYRLILTALLLLPVAAHAGDAEDFLAANPTQQAKLLQDWAAQPDPARIELVDALQQGQLTVNGETKTVRLNNRLRGLIDNVQASLQLLAADPKVRLAAAQTLQKTAQPAQLKFLDQRVAAETVEEVHSALSLALANLQLVDSDPLVRLAAVRLLGSTGDPLARTRLETLLAPGVETDAAVHTAAETSLAQVKRKLMLGELLGQAFSGMSLGSILLLAALGLAITFGLLGVINMAHGEMLMLGAYSTYVVQLLMQRYVPHAIEFYPLIALPVAFFVTAAIGMALERTVIRHLYGRPLETLLATWGISLMLIQLVRLVFGAQNVEVANPAWLSGGIQVLPNLVLPYNRIVIIAFALCVVVLTWLLLNKTRLGLNVRAVTQNRNMAACCGVPTGRVDMLAFGLGSGIAGLGGVALSQIGNVGPDLGQSYIIDSFLVVVLGGVGQLAGSVMAAFGLGIANKILEPQIGAVLGKILILALIILFIQKRPQGLFALKGRVID